jgi:glutathione S-transferase
LITTTQHTMADLILHQFASSPFSEKVRLVLGFKRLRSRAVEVPMLLPKPDVVALTGGYRRTPFLQIGADIYCDSALMCRVLDRLRPEPPLYPGESAGLAEIVAQWADAALFWSAIPFTIQSGGTPYVMPDSTPEYLKAFAADRSAMTTGMRRLALPDSAAALHAYLLRIEALLADGRPFLLGALPSIADFACVQAVWFMHLAPPVAKGLATHPRIEAWYARMHAFGHRESVPMASAEAIAVAAASTSHEPVAVQDGLGFGIGEAVTVNATDYGADLVAGTLVGLTRESVTIERRDERAGTLHVHFPRIGFQIRKEKKE